MSKLTSIIVFVFCCLLFVVSALVGCGSSGSTAVTTTTCSTPTTTTTISGGGIASLFDVSGASAIASATTSKLGSSGILGVKEQDATSTYSLLKLVNGQLVSATNTTESGGWLPQISVIEVGPDGNLYVGFYYAVYSYSGYNYTKLGAFFKIMTNGSIEVVDPDIDGIGTWYSSTNNGDLPVKQVQFDSSGNMYYLGRVSNMGSCSTALKKKAVSGTITSVSDSTADVRDFIVCPNGFVLFHGSDAGNWSNEWLKVYYGVSKHNVFSNSGSYGWLRSYFKDANNNVILVGSGLMLYDAASGNDISYSGIIRARLTANGVLSTVEALYDDKNMYNETYTSIGQQLNYGYWDPATVTYKKFFKNTGGSSTLPLTLETGVSEEGIRAYIRGKFHSIAADTLNTVTFEGMTTNESWNVSGMLDTVINANITGETWTTWRNNNEMQGVSFGNAKQLLYDNSNGSLYAIMNLDTWGAGSVTKGDKIFKVLNASGEAIPIAYPKNSIYKRIQKAKILGDTIVYLSNTSQNYKLLSLNKNDPTIPPVDLTPLLDNCIIYNFNYNPVTNMLMYNVHDQNTNTTYLAQQLLTSTTISTQSSAEGFGTITDIVTFEANVTTTTTVTTTSSSTTSITM